MQLPLLNIRPMCRLFQLQQVNWGYRKEERQPLWDGWGTVPAVLDYYYATLGRAPALNHTQDDLLSPTVAGGFDELPDHRPFYRENQGACLWALRRDELEKDDPPVWGSADRQQWWQETPCLSVFLQTMAHLQAIFALEYRSEGFQLLDAAARAIVEAHYHRRTLGLNHWLDGVAIYGNRDQETIVLLEANGPNPQMKYAAATAHRFAKLAERLESLGEPL